MPMNHGAQETQIGRSGGLSRMDSVMSTSMVDLPSGRPSTSSRALGPGGTRLLRADEAAALESQDLREEQERRERQQRLNKYYESRSRHVAPKPESDTDSQDDYGSDAEDSLPVGSPVTLSPSVPGRVNLGAAFEVAGAIQSPNLAGLSSPSKRALYNCTLLKVHPSLADAVLATNAFEVLRASLGGSSRQPSRVSTSSRPNDPSSSPAIPTPSNLKPDAVSQALGAGVVVVPQTGTLVYPRSMNAASDIAVHESSLSSSRCLGVALARKKVMQRLVRPLSVAHDVELGWFQRRYGSELIPSPLVARAVAARRATPEALVKAPTPETGSNPEEVNNFAALKRWTQRSSFAERNISIVPYAPQLGGLAYFDPDENVAAYAAYPVAPPSSRRRAAPLTYSNRITGLAQVPARLPPKAITVSLRKATRHREWRPGAPGAPSGVSPVQPKKELTPAQQVSREYAKAQAARAQADKLQAKLAQRRPAPWSKDSNRSSTTMSQSASYASHHVPDASQIQRATSPGPGGYAAAYAAAVLEAESHQPPVPHPLPRTPSRNSQMSFAQPSTSQPFSRAASAVPTPQQSVQPSRTTSAAPTPQHSARPSPAWHPAPLASAPQSRRTSFNAPTKPDKIVDTSDHGAAQPKRSVLKHKAPPSAFRPVAGKDRTSVSVPASPVTHSNVLPQARPASRADSQPLSRPTSRSSYRTADRTPVSSPDSPGDDDVAQVRGRASVSSHRSTLPDPRSAEGQMLEQKLQALQASMLQRRSHSRSSSAEKGPGMGIRHPPSQSSVQVLRPEAPMCRTEPLHRNSALKVTSRAVSPQPSTSSPQRSSHHPHPPSGLRSSTAATDQVDAKGRLTSQSHTQGRGLYSLRSASHSAQEVGTVPRSDSANVGMDRGGRARSKGGMHLKASASHTDVSRLNYPPGQRLTGRRGSTQAHPPASNASTSSNAATIGRRSSTQLVPQHEGTRSRRGSALGYPVRSSMPQPWFPMPTWAPQAYPGPAPPTYHYPSPIVPPKRESVQATPFPPAHHMRY